MTSALHTSAEKLLSVDPVDTDFEEDIENTVRVAEVPKELLTKYRYMLVLISDEEVSKSTFNTLLRDVKQTDTDRSVVTVSFNLVVDGDEPKLVDRVIEAQTQEEQNREFVLSVPTMPFSDDFDMTRRMLYHQVCTDIADFEAYLKNET
jgi:hypothetical protein